MTLHGCCYTSLLVFTVLAWNSVRCSNDYDPMSIVDYVTHRSRYDNRLSPTAKEETPTEVKCQMGIRSIWSLSHQTMDFQVDMYLVLAWNDSRLFQRNLQKEIILNHEQTIEKFWKPEIYFPNARSGEFQKLMVPNHILYIIPSDDNITGVAYITRFIMKFSCLMNLRKYPMDKQKCVIEISTLGKEEGIDLKWMAIDQPISIHPKVKLPNFDIVQIIPGTCDEHYKLGNYSCLEAEFHLERLLGYHIVQNFIPTILIVFISWVAFWMDVEAVPGRVTLGITTLLTVSSKATGVQAKLPEVSYVKAIDIWMGTCTAFVFLALCEFVLAHYLCRMHKIAMKAKEDIKIEGLSEKQQNLIPEKKPPFAYTRVDELARVIFPSTFLCFSIVYWTFFLHFSEDEY